MTDHDQLGLGLRYDDDHHRPHRRRRHSRFGRFLLFLVVLAVVVAVPVVLLVGGSRLLHLGQGPADYAGTGTGTVQVHIQPGDSATEIAQRLEQAGVVKSVGAFTEAARHDPRATGVQPGYYRLHRHMSGRAALDLLLQPSSRIETSVTLPEGSTAAQIFSALAATGRFSVAELQAAAKRATDLGLPAYAHGKVEGFLFPATYQVDPGTSASDVLTLMLTQFATHAQQLGLSSGAKALGHSPYDIVTIASMVEKEAGLAQDFPKVARVVYNRLRAGMPLQFDSTLNYVLPRRKGHLSTQDLKNPSPYNTYNHKGLPPTPIDNPGQAALKAALNPAPGPWLYFVTIDKQGHTAFATTYQQFLRDRAVAHRNGVIP